MRLLQKGMMDSLMKEFEDHLVEAGCQELMKVMQNT